MWTESVSRRALAAAIEARGIHCVHVGAADGWPDPDGALRASLGGARLVIVRPDRVIAASAATLDVDLVDVYAARLGIPPEAL